MLASTSPWFGAALLLAVGLYQWTPWKNACLDHCRAPAGFFAEHWRPGIAGAFRMGIAHGSYCLGCCWLLMGLLFFGGVMNLLWVAGLTLFVLIEKLVPRGDLLARAAGVALLLAGGAQLLSASQAAGFGSRSSSVPWAMHARRSPFDTSTRTIAVVRVIDTTVDSARSVPSETGAR
jgi:predicted metal-binding membrane protein